MNNNLNGFIEWVVLIQSVGQEFITKMRVRIIHLFGTIKDKMFHRIQMKTFILVSQEKNA